jgi:hypothetical protein
VKIRTSSVKTVIGQVTAELQTIFHWLLFDTQKGKPYENLKSTDIDVEVVGLESQIHTRVADVVRISDQILKWWGWNTSRERSRQSDVGKVF